MGTIFQSLDSDLQKFIREQRVFFIASAPLAQAGHVNLSPKGLCLSLTTSKRSFPISTIIACWHSRSSPCVCDGRRVVEPDRRGALAEATSVAGSRRMPAFG